MIYTKNKFMFRGKDVKSEDWHRGFRTYKIENGNVMPLILSGSKLKAGIYNDIRDNSTQLLSTFKDVEGTYYGEGDIVLTNEINSPYRFIDFADGCFVARGLFEKKTRFLFDFCNKFKGRIVGNLYDYEDFFKYYGKTYQCKENFTVDSDFEKENSKKNEGFFADDEEEAYQYRKGICLTYFGKKGDIVTVLDFNKNGEIPRELSMPLELFLKNFVSTDRMARTIAADEGGGMSPEELKDMLKNLKEGVEDG